MKKYVSDLRIACVEYPRDGYVLLKVTNDNAPLPEILPGQFVEIRVDGAQNTFLRRPISVNFVDRTANQLWLLVHVVGEGTRRLAELQAGETLNCVYPLGNGFSMPEAANQKLLLVGGGVGTAPLLYYGAMLKERGHQPTFLLGGRRATDLMQLEVFSQFGEVLTTTEDGTHGTQGFVTQHGVWQSADFNGIATCGPKPMMKAVARMAAERNIPCEVSLENMMACGLGACLCCVEDTKDGHVCVCQEGPVFNASVLKDF